MNIIRTENFNTNNAWGFGGAIGCNTYYDNGIMVKTGRNYHRHSGTSSANLVYVEAAEDFFIPLRTKNNAEVRTLEGVSVISVLVSGSNYWALLGDIETAERFGMTYSRIKTIHINN